MASANEPPPRPPPHGSQPRPPGSGLPEGNYDIFIVPPHSAGSGFLYLPSLSVQRNSFLAGVACTLLAVGMYTIIMPALRDMIGTMMAGGGVGVLLLVIGVGVACWAWGKTQGENVGGSGFGFGGGTGSAWGGAGQQQQAPGGAGAGPQAHANGHAPPPKPETKPNASSSGWEKAREETRKREEARKREEEAKKKREEAQKAKEEAERASKAKAEKDKWEQARAREKETREREARERIAREREAREKAAKSGYKKPTARSFDGTEEEYSYRPYDKSSPHKAGHKSSASSISGLSDTSYAASHTTARTTPPPSQRGPYHTTDGDKIQIKAVYLFSDSFPLKPLASLIANTGSVTDGLILRLKTEGLFIDDDVRGVPQREWDVKAWTIKGVEDGMYKIPHPPPGPSGGNGGNGGGGAGIAAASKAAGKAIHVLRATTRDEIRWSSLSSFQNTTRHIAMNQMNDSV